MTVLDRIIATVVGGLFLAILSYVGLRAWRALRKSSAVVFLQLADDSKVSGIKLSMRHMRDGKDEIKDSGGLINEDRKFRKEWFRNTWVAETFYTGNLGFQFKCHIDFPESLRSEALDFIGKNGFIEPTNDETVKGRIWFLIPGVAICKTKDVPPYTNNYFHPRIESIVHPT